MWRDCQRCASTGVGRSDSMELLVYIILAFDAAGISSRVMNPRYQVFVCTGLIKKNPTEYNVPIFGETGLLGGVRANNSSNSVVCELFPREGVSDETSGIMAVFRTSIRNIFEIHERKQLRTPSINNTHVFFCDVFFIIDKFDLLDES